MIVFISTVAFSGTALARGSEKAHEKDHGKDELAIEKQFSVEKLKKLDLSKEQREKLKDLREAHKGDTEKLREELRQAKKAFKEALRSNGSKEDVMKSFEAVAQKKAELGRARISGLLEAREVLTPDQRAKLFESKDD
jgi:Spy/CpxP family protein refolding chaperone